MVDLSISIVTRNERKLLEDCLKSILENDWKISYEVFVVDNNSSDGSTTMVKENFPQVKLFEMEENIGFTKTNNLAIRKSSGRYILLLNSDTKLFPHSLDLLVDFLDGHPEAGAVGPKLIFFNGKQQKSCLGFPTLGAMLCRIFFIEQLWPQNRFSKAYQLSDWDHDSEKEVDQIMGAALMVRKSVVDKVGLLDEKIRYFFDEVDWCYRIKKSGAKIYFYPTARVNHLGGASFKKWNPLRLGWQWDRSRDYYFKKHWGLFSVFILRLADLIRAIIIISLISILLSLPFLLIKSWLF